MKTIKEKIQDYLKNNEDLINLKDLSREIKISYPTILKYCEVLLAEGKVEIKDYGNVKLIKIK